MPKHKHHKEIIAWAGGARIERKNWDLSWSYEKNPSWHEGSKYRVKPKANVALTIFVTRWIDINKIDMYGSGSDNVRFIFDGETNKLINVEMIK